ncbi:hypothetical protein [Phreatobacter stygius]|uniref:Uncharacterized protein n=1 Tax=Phreatobacter stygius TaxID=1940610 RepID=A0A4D7B3B8_9HYPH|nr:hypothetical protein [Phreatobacter stygius]QCI65543.1 hypothetical protein E8M01_15805 [Phreatobacter stygius]
MTTVSGLLADLAELFQRTSRARLPLSAGLAGRLAEGLRDLAAEARRLEDSERRLMALCAEPADRAETASEAHDPAASAVIIDLPNFLGRDRAPGPARTTVDQAPATIIPLMAVPCERHPAGGEEP